MKQLNAPWRITYIRSAPKAKGCLFCRAAAARRDEALLVLHRGRTCFTMLNRFPYNGGHLLVAPYAHRGRLKAMTAEEMRELLTETRDMEVLLDRVLRPHGYNLGINVGRTAGQGVAGHLHFHIVPRWDGDTNFMPVTADTKVVSEALADLHARLRAELRTRRGRPGKRGGRRRDIH